jgi:hypothetical protein
MFLLAQGVNPLSSSLWAHFLQTRDLVVLQIKSSGFEVYSPHDAILNRHAFETQQTILEYLPKKAKI